MKRVHRVARSVERNRPSLRNWGPAPLVVIGALLWGSSAGIAWAEPPDLTAGGEPTNSVTINLGPTGMRGWVYHRRASTEESRQILVTAVDAGSPADGVLAPDDVILGADGTGTNPEPFSSDARRSFAKAIADAEARTPAELKLLRWRDGTTTTQTLSLQYLEAYSDTAPYDCAKSAQILATGLDAAYQHELTNTGGNYRNKFNFISLLLSDNPDHLSRVQTVARGLVPTAATRAQMMADTPDTSSMITWERGYVLILLAEYYLLTGDAYVLPGIEAYAVNIAKNQSHFGTVGHRYADWNLDGSPNGPTGGVYGAVNQTSLTCFLGLVLALECGLTNPELAPAIERTSTFFGSYSGKACIPYGEHAPGGTSHENNGTSGSAALALSRVPGRESEARFFAKMATAGAEDRDRGHTGPWWNYLWAPLGANVGGEEAAAAHFSEMSWYLDLARTWQGRFVYDNINGEGPDSGSTYHDFRMLTPALLTYGMPLRKLHIAGRNQNPDSLLASTDVDEALTAIEYDAASRTMDDLFGDLEGWSPKVRGHAAIEIAARGVTSAQLDELHTIASDTTLEAGPRAGACEALRRIRNASSAPVLAALLTDADAYVRFSATQALRYLSDDARQSVLNTILEAAASTARPTFPLDEQDPLQFAHGNLGMLLFYHWSAYGPRGILWNRWNTLESQGLIDREKLYPAIRAIAATPVGLYRSTLNRMYDERLTVDDFLAVSGAAIDAIRFRSPADRMFSGGVREGGVRAMLTYGISEGVPSCMEYLADEVGGRRRIPIGQLGDFGGSVHTVVPDPGAVPFLETYLSDWEVGDDAQAALDKIVADTDPVTLVPLKSILSASVDHPVMHSRSTELRVSARDHARGDSVFTWTRLEGPGDATFGDSSIMFCEDGVFSESTTTVEIDVPGDYLFEVTMSDSRGLTEVSETVSITVPVRWASGGEISYADGHFTHVFREGGDTEFVVPGQIALAADVLVVAGGGGGGSSTAESSAGAGGGGAGGLVHETGLSVSGTSDVVVGGGGAGGGSGNNPGSNGANSSFGAILALGGGGGAGGVMAGLDGGSGGGGRGGAGGTAQQPGSVSGGFGHNGATWTGANQDGGGGGGGAGGAAPTQGGGPPRNARRGGDGGTGRSYDISGATTTYAGGGGGGASGNNAVGSGGSGIGGNGANDNTAPTAGAAHTGSGGGGGNSSRTGASGGSGIVIVRYATPATYRLTVTGGSGGGEYGAGAVIEITADAAPLGKEFDVWTGDTAGVADVNSATTTVTMSDDEVQLTATYRDSLYLLTVNSGSGDGEYAYGTVVEITADAAPLGKEFDAWTGDTDGVADVSSATTTITMPAGDAQVTATYRDILYPLTVTGGTGGGEYAYGAVVEITADAAPEGQVFLAWTGDVDLVTDVNSAGTTLTMPAGPAAVEATYGHLGIPFVETFEDLAPGALHGQRGWVAEQVVVQDATTFGGSSQAAAIEENCGSLRRTFTDGRNEVWTDLRVRVQTMTDDTVPVPPAGSTAFVYAGPEFEVMVFDGAEAVQTGVIIEEDAWVRFTLHSDYGTSTWKLYVNGSLAGTYAFHETAAASYTKFEVKGGTSTFVDDIAITLEAPDLGLPPPIDDLYLYALDNQNPGVRVDGGLLLYSHLLRNDDARLVYQLETRASLLLGEWENAELVPAETNLTGTVFDEVSYRIPMEDPVRFFRLRIYQQPD